MTFSARANSALLLAALFAVASAAAQPFPSRPVRMVVHIGPGSSMDIVARALAQKLSDTWGQSIIVDNRAGAGGTIGMDVGAKAPPDGYTLLFATSSLAIASSYYRKLPFDAARDLEPVTQVSSRHNVLVVVPSSPINSVKELIAAARARPKQFTYGSGGGAGSSDHLAGEMLGQSAGVEFLHVPYKSGPGAMNDLIGGRLSFYFGGIPVNLPMIQAGKLKPLATSGLKRSPQLPNVPTIAEAALPGFEVNVWYGLFVPARTPQRVVEKIAGDVIRILNATETRERFTNLGVEAEGTTPQACKAYYLNDIAKWAKVVKAAGVTAD